MQFVHNYNLWHSGRLPARSCERAMPCQIGATVIIPHAARDYGPVRVALTGANGGYGRTLLAQLLRTPELIPAVLVDPDVDGLRRTLDELGIPADRVAEAADPAATARLVEQGRIALFSPPTPWTGTASTCSSRRPASGRSALLTPTAALNHGTHVVMVSKEVDTVVGVTLGHAPRRSRTPLPAGRRRPARQPAPPRRLGIRHRARDRRHRQVGGVRPRIRPRHGHSSHRPG